MTAGKENKEERISILVDKIKTEPITSFLQSEIIEISEGYAKVSLVMRPEFQNFHGIIFGGIIMSVVDQAFGAASNSMAYPSVASNLNVYFISSARVGDKLTAEGRVIKSGRKAGFTEVTVVNQDNKLVARAIGITIPTKQGE
ncbi:MAG: PaaI family thioesterase [Dehalococcoidales bacterium]|jgi:acyl-CoA thioesterase|nr:PaaI family thioesterase [Dehalococcoidales bacterium]